MKKITFLICVFLTCNAFAITEEEYCMNSAQTAVFAAKQFYDTNKSDISTARKVHSSIISSDMKRIERISGKLGSNEMLIMKSIDNFTKFGICEAYRKKSDLNLIKLHAFNACKELLKRDFSISNCLD